MISRLAIGFGVSFSVIGVTAVLAAAPAGVATALAGPPGSAILGDTVPGIDSAPAAAQDSRIRLNEEEIANLVPRPGVGVEPLDILELILRNAGDEIYVYPSEGYYYYEYQSGPATFKGNIRFDARVDYAGKIAFAVFTKTHYEDYDQFYFAWLGSQQGVYLTQSDPFTYLLTFRNKKTVVHIYDAAQELAARPPLRPSERYVGPVFDESGVRFHLIFDTQSNALFFALNENMPAAETYTALAGSDKIKVGDRTSFAFIKDADPGRWILIGVRQLNISQNNWFDGPFDQLPDRFADPMLLQRYIELSSPDTVGTIGPRGWLLNDPGSRAMVNPYRQYYDEEELNGAAECLESINRVKISCLKSWW